MTTSVQAQLEEIVVRGDVEGALSMFRTLDNESQKGLAPLVKSLYAYYSEEVENEKDRWGPRATNEQDKVLHLAMLFTFPKTELSKIPILRSDFREVESLLSFYIPEGFGEMLNESAKRGWLRYRITYGWVMSLKERGILDPCPELIVRTLLPCIGGVTPKGREIFSIERLYEFPETLRSHVWLFFSHYSVIFDHSAVGAEGEKRTWKNAFLTLSTNGDLDRLRLLRECLLAVPRNLSKFLNNWYLELFKDLNPKASEILGLQTELNALFSLGHNGAMCLALHSLKKSCTHPDFSRQEFLENCPLALASQTLGVINECISVLDKLTGKYPREALEVFRIASEALTHPKANAQVRVARLIRKHATLDLEREIREMLEPYSEYVCAEAKELLSEYLENTESTLPKEGKGTLPAVLSDENRIEYPENIEEFVFFLSQVFDQRNVHSFDIFLDSLVRFYPEINPEDLPKFDPALQKSLRVSAGVASNRASFTDRVMAVTFLEYSGLLIERFPEGSKTLRGLRDRFLKADKAKHPVKYFPNRGNRFYLETWSLAGQHPFLHIFYKRALEALRLLRKGKTLPLLASPTHKPAWICPDTLIEKTKLWQDAGEELCVLDWENAIARLAFENNPKIPKKALSEIQGQPGEILTYMLNGESSDIKNPESVWSTASITKNEEPAKGYVFTDEPRRYYYWETKPKGKEERRKILDFEGVEYCHEVEDISYPFKGENMDGFYSSIGLSRVKLGHLGIDTLRYLALAPHHHEKLLAAVVANGFRYSDSLNEASTWLVSTSVLNYLLEYSQEPFQRSETLFLALIATGPSKELREQSVGLWERGVYFGLLDDGKFGEALGKMYAMEFVPLKRFTDLVSSSMLNLSVEKNQALRKALETMMTLLDDKPIKGLKALLEIYGELVFEANTAVPDTLTEKFEVWGKVNSLKRIINRLTARN
ncbi:hypothetical protein FUAX_18050 [Fulvitalea axinellae]|uniref:Uncharacterized protein n=1 Tax=Fulvitalea axinellae TaxID=1182444 RepID=A0AAU9CH65_9BACT|nr:hypothetical protein FUAX_18050 [Fulvitalea axinellae]